MSMAINPSPPPQKKKKKLTRQPLPSQVQISTLKTIGRGMVDVVHILQHFFVGPATLHHFSNDIYVRNDFALNLPPLWLTVEF
jgi:hypothetical protein